MKHARTRTVRAFVALVALAVGIGLLLLWQRTVRPARAEGATVTVKRGTVTLKVEEVGVVEPLRKVEIKSKVSGQVSRVLVDVGAVVKADDVLIELDGRDAQHEIDEADARREVLAARLAAARQQLGFRTQGHGRGVFADSDLAAAEAEATRLALEVRVAAAERRRLEDRLGYTRVRSPIAGVVLARNAEPGEMVSAGVSATVNGRPLLVVAQIDKMLVRTEVSPLDAARLSIGVKATVRIDALEGRTFEGEVYRVAAMGQLSERRRDSTLQVFPVDVVLSPDQEGAGVVRPGMVADLEIVAATHASTLTVPLEAVVREGGSVRLRKLSGAKETLVDVTLGLTNDRTAEVLSGINEGEAIRLLPSSAAALLVR